MQCGDLERYLEAFLDGRLGRSRSAILRRHLAMCGGCRARIERLRQFERDMQRRFRSMSQDRSLWQGLELDLVTTGRSGASHLLALPRLLPTPRHEPAPEPGMGPVRTRHPLLVNRPGTRGRASRLAGVVLIAMALGAVYQIARTQLVPADDSDSVVRAYHELLRQDRVLALASSDKVQLQAWLTSELGAPVSLPATPQGYRPLGADRALLSSGPAGAVVYGRAEGGQADALLLLIHPQAQGSSAPGTEPRLAEYAAVPGMHELSWVHDAARYTLLGSAPQEDMRRFADEPAVPQ